MSFTASQIVEPQENGSSVIGLCLSSNSICLLSSPSDEDDEINIWNRNGRWYRSSFEKSARRQEEDDPADPPKLESLDIRFITSTLLQPVSQQR